MLRLYILNFPGCLYLGVIPTVTQEDSGQFKISFASSLCADHTEMIIITVEYIIIVAARYECPMLLLLLTKPFECIMIMAEWSQM